MGYPSLADVGCRAEGRQMGTHQGGKIDHNAAQRKSKRQPAVLGDILRLRPVGRHGNQIPGHQPDTDVGGHAQQHGYCRQEQS